MHSFLALLASFTFLAAGCGRKDNSADTDKATSKLRSAEGKVTEHQANLTENEAAIAQRERDLVREQQELADRKQLLDQQGVDLGTANDELVTARATYAAAVAVRMAKLDASLAALETRTDAAARDAAVGLRARRDQLALRVAALTGAASADFKTATSDIDVTFDAIEKDLGSASR